MRKTLFIFALLSVGLLLGACRDDKKTATINMEIFDSLYRPNEFTVPAGAEVTVTADQLWHCSAQFHHL